MKNAQLGIKKCPDIDYKINVLAWTSLRFIYFSPKVPEATPEAGPLHSPFWF